MRVVMFLKILTVILTISFARGQYYEDKRCRCICPSLSALLNRTLTDRKIFTSNVPPNNCNCEGVILKIVGDLKTHKQEFCLRCECKYQTRNTTIIMIVVILLLWSLTFLSGYMAFLICLNPLMNRWKNLGQRFNYREANSEEAVGLLVQDAEE